MDLFAGSGVVVAAELQVCELAGGGRLGGVLGLSLGGGILGGANQCFQRRRDLLGNGIGGVYRSFLAGFGVEVKYGTGGLIEEVKSGLKFDKRYNG